jgi:hypothetical protein
MAAPTIYRSADAGAPVLFNSHVCADPLDACLVNGYGGGFAVGTITSDGVNVADGDTVTVGVRTYTFRTTRAAIGDVLIGGSAAASLTNLVATINLFNASVPSQYFAGTLGNADAGSPGATATVLSVQARVAGYRGQRDPLARTSAGTPHLTVSGTALAGGAAGSSKASAGWTKDYASLGRAIYRPGAGTLLPGGDRQRPRQLHLRRAREGARVRDDHDARHRYRALDRHRQFGQQSFMNVWKAGSQPSVTPAAPWILMADSRTAYLWYFGVSIVRATRSSRSGTCSH